jgi:hypothetical protein
LGVAQQGRDWSSTSHLSLPQHRCKSAMKLTCLLLLLLPVLLLLQE